MSARLGRLLVTVLFSPKKELLLRKSAPGLAMWRDKNPWPPCSTGGVRNAGGGVMPWDEARSDG
jgi:hypothetical protein